MVRLCCWRESCFVSLGCFGPGLVMRSHLWVTISIGGLPRREPLVVHVMGRGQTVVGIWGNLGYFLMVCVLSGVSGVSGSGLGK